MPTEADGLAAAIQTDPVATTFFELLARLHAERYTGAVILHVAAGVPKKAEFPTKVVAGVQVALK